MCEISWSENCVPDGEDYAPSAEELESLYGMLENGNIPELQLKYERYADDDARPMIQKAAQATKDMELLEPIKNDFDFSDDGGPQPLTRVRSLGSTPKSAKKKQANFAGVMEMLKKKNAEGST